MVACYPAPNSGEAPFGAHPKRDWPDPHAGEDALFVSPLSPGCESRFVFDFEGVVAPHPGDAAATETIRRLILDDRSAGGILTPNRRSAITATLNNRALPLADARKRLRVLEQQEASGGRLDEFCFALKQALLRHIRQVEARVQGIRATRMKTQ